MVCSGPCIIREGLIREQFSVLQGRYCPHSGDPFTGGDGGRGGVFGGAGVKARKVDGPLTALEIQVTV